MEDQVDRLLSALSPGVLTTINEQVETYQREMVEQREHGEVAWCEKVRGQIKEMIEAKT